MVPLKPTGLAAKADEMCFTFPLRTDMRPSFHNEMSGTGPDAKSKRLIWENQCARQRTSLDSPTPHTHPILKAAVGCPDQERTGIARWPTGRHAWSHWR